MFATLCEDRHSNRRSYPNSYAWTRACTVCVARSIILKGPAVSRECWAEWAVCPKSFRRTRRLSIHLSRVQICRYGRNSRYTIMTIAAHSCFKSAALLSTRHPTLAPFIRRGPHSRKVPVPSTCHYHSPAWFSHLNSETLLFQVSHRCLPSITGAHSNSYGAAF